MWPEPHWNALEGSPALFWLGWKDSEEKGRTDGSCLSGSQQTATQIKQQSQGKKNKNRNKIKGKKKKENKKGRRP